MVFDPNVFDPDVFDAGDGTNAQAGLVSGTGSAHDATIETSNANAGLASGTGVAFDATAQTGTYVAAELASGTGSAGAASAHIKVNANATILPDFVAMGTRDDDAAADISPAIPSGTAAGDILLLVVETNHATVANPDSSVWTELSVSPWSSTAGTNPTRISAFWRVAISSTPAPTVVFSADHVFGVIAGFRGVDTLNPIHQIATYDAAGNPASYTAPSVTTTVPNTLIVNIATSGRDQTSTALFQTPTNANLDDLQVRYHQGLATGDGGCIWIATGEKATAGSTGTTTGTLAVGGNTQIAITVALSPPVDTVATGRAYDAVVSTVQNIYGNAEAATGTGDAQAAYGNVAPRPAAATGTGAAAAVSASVAVNAEAATGTGAAHDATASTTFNVNASAEAATGTGAAGDIDAAIAPRAGQAAGSGAASNATVSTSNATSASAEAVTGTGTAYDAVIDYAIRGNAQNAAGTGTASNPRIHIKPRAGAATGVGAAYDTTVAAIDDYDYIQQDIATGYMPPLAAPIDDDDTTITVTTSSGSASEVPFLVVIDDEQMLVTAVVGATWTVERGYNGTVATAHGAGTLARPALVRITVGGVDITADVSYQRSRFATGANGQAGLAEIWIRDLDRNHEFVTGAEVRVSFRGIYQWGGYLTAIRRQYVFESGTGNISDEPRWLLLDCVDYNVLLNKRIYRLASDPTFMKVKHWPNSTWDSVVIDEVVHSYLNLGSAGLTYDINHVGTPALTQISCDPNASDTFGVGSAGWTWGQVMQSIASQTGAVYYIDPDKVFRYVDDTTKQSRFGYNGVSDVPGNTEDTSENVSVTTRDDFDRTVAGGWGTGDLGVWTQDGAGTVSVDGAEALTAGSGFFYQTVPLASEIVDSESKLVQIRFELAATGNEAIGIEITDVGSSNFVAAYFNFLAAGTDSIDLNTTGESDSVSVSPFDRTEYGLFKAEVDQATGTARAKVWNEGDTEPGWLITVVDPSLIGPDLELIAIARDSSASTTARFDWVEATYDTVVFTPGTALIGYRDVEFMSDGTRLTNDHLQWGAGKGRDEMVFHRTTDDDSIASHGLWQTAEVRFDLYCQDSVDQRGNTWVYGSPQNHRGGKDDRFFTRFTVREPYFRCADVIIVKSHEFDITRTVPIRAAEITFPTPWDYRGVLTASHEIDAPWSTLEFWMPQFDFETPVLELPGIPELGLPDLPDPWQPHDDCEDMLGECIVSDDFERTGASLGTADSGHIWGVPIGVTNTYTPTTNGSEAVLQVEPGFSAGSETAHVGSGRLNLSTEGELFVPMTARFTFRYSGEWNSTFLQNPVLDGADPARRWAPGYAAPEVATSLVGVESGDNYHRTFLQVAVSASIPIYRFNIFNFGGSLYAAARDTGTVNDETRGAVFIGPQLEPGQVCNVWVHLDSDRVYLKVWPEGSPMPSYYQVETEVSGTTWHDQEFLIFSRASVKNDFQPAFTMYVDDLCIARTTYAGEGLPGFNSASETFTRSGQGDSWGLSEWGGEWDTSGLGTFEVDGNYGRASNTGSGLDPAVLTGLDGRFSADIEILAHVKWPFDGHGTSSGMKIYTSENPFGTYVAWQLRPVDEDSFDLRLEEFGDDVGTSIDVRYDEGWTPQFGGSPGDNDVWVRVRFEDAIARVKVWRDGDTEPATYESRSFTGANIESWATSFDSIDVVSGISSLGVGEWMEWDIITFVSGFAGQCSDAAPGSTSDPLHDGPSVGEGADSTYEVGDNGGIIFHTDEQFQLASTEVWVDGLRIRLGEDYIEYPRQAMIEILDHIDVGTEEDPATVLVSYRIWTLDDPMVE